MKALIWMLGLVGVVGTLALAACSSDDSSSSPCQSASKKLCEKACACTGGGKCSIGDANAAFTINGQASCEALYSAGCASTATKTPDWNACSAALDSAACVMGTEGKVLTFPNACND